MTDHPLSDPRPDFADGHAVTSWQSKAIVLAYVFLAALALALLVSLGNLSDPFARHDDYPAVLGDAVTYYWKTLTEGRWLNYWYISLNLRLPTEVSFVGYLAGWSLFAAAFATHAFQPGSRVMPGSRILLAWLIVLSPQQFEIAQWFNTVAIGIWIMAAYAVICLFAPRRVSEVLLLVFVPLSFSAYNTYPFYLLALLLTRVDHERSLGGLVRIVLLFGLAFAAAMLLTDVLNWYFHGVFGIDEAGWRSPNHVGSLADLAANLKPVGLFWSDLSLVYGMGYVVLGKVILVVSLLLALAVLRLDPWLGLYVLTPVALGLGLLTFYTLSTGVFVPARATVFLWLVSSFLLVLFIGRPGTGTPRRIVTVGCTLALLAFFSKEFVARFEYFQVWQTSTRELADRLPGDSEKLVVFGDFEALSGAREAAIQSLFGLEYRLQYLTGMTTVFCDHEHVDCSAETPPFDPVPQTGSLLVETSGGVTYVRLPGKGPTS